MPAPHTLLAQRCQHVDAGLVGGWWTGCLPRHPETWSGCSVYNRCTVWCRGRRLGACHATMTRAKWRRTSPSSASLNEARSHRRHCGWSWQVKKLPGRQQCSTVAWLQQAAAATAAFACQSQQDSGPGCTVAAGCLPNELMPTDGCVTSARRDAIATMWAGRAAARMQHLRPAPSCSGCPACSNSSHLWRTR